MIVLLTNNNHVEDEMYVHDMIIMRGRGEGNCGG